MTMRAFKVGNADRQRITKVQAAYYPFWLRLELDGYRGRQGCTAR